MSTAADTAIGLGAVDLTMLAVLAISAAVGLWRGFIFEAASLLGWVVAYFGAQRWSPALTAHATLEGWVPQAWAGSVGAAASFALVFLGVMLVWMLGARLVRRLVQATPLALPDRLVGGVFGLLRGVVVLLVVVTVVAWTPLQSQDAWQASQGRAWLERVIEGLRPFWPDAAQRWLPGGD